MITAGVDLSAEDDNTCLAVIEWTADSAVVRSLHTRVSNAEIVSTVAAVDKLGIDCPFGWPEPFVEFVRQHQHGDVPPQAGVPIDWRRRLANRHTDLVVRERFHLVPLSVGADRIAHAAFRCAALLAELTAAGAVVDRSGVTGLVAEVYPSASLHQWNLMHRGYKHDRRATHLAPLVGALLGEQAAPWLDLGEHRALCEVNDDAFDAVVAALSARAVALGRTVRPTADEQRLAEREGWIAVPVSGSLPGLVGRADGVS